MKPAHTITGLITDLTISLVLAIIPLSLLHPELMLSANLPTGGDMASQIFGAKIFVTDIFPQGKLSAWLPEVFGGFPFLSYYFPLPFITMALLAKLLSFAVAFKVTAMLGIIVLPAIVYGVGRFLGFHRLSALAGSLGALCFMLHEQHSIWGGNLLSTLAGEFAYSYGMVFSVITLAVWSRGIKDGRYWVLGGCLEVLVGMSHGYALLVTGFTTTAFLFQTGRFKANFLYLVRTHSLAVLLLGFWLWPLIETGPYITPNDSPYLLNNWQDILPMTVRPVLIAGLLAIFITPLIPNVRRGWTTDRIDHALLFLFGGVIALVGWFASERIGLADIRFFPYAWLMGCVVSGWFFGNLLERLIITLPARGLAGIGLLFLTLGFLSLEVRQAPHWTLWNHSGLESKVMWPTLEQLFPKLKGDLNSPRLVFEHDPDNNDLGSTRVLETLPMFLGGRPVLEGLYMESAPLGPVIYQLQSEISARPSSPLSQFPSGSLDPVRAALHMAVLNTQDILVRSDNAKKELTKSGLYEIIGGSPPFEIYRLKDFSNSYVTPINGPVSVTGRQNWKEKSFAWFQKLKSPDDPPLAFLTPQQTQERQGLAWPEPTGIERIQAVSGVTIERERIRFTTSAIGVPHLIRFGFNPRWQSKNGETIYLVSPGYMMVVPAHREVELFYGSTKVMRWGKIASVLALFFILGYGLFFVLQRRGQHLIEETHRSNSRFSRRWWLIRLTAIPLLLMACGGLYFQSPKRVYQRGHQYFRSQKYEEAARYFDQAFAGRHVKAQKEEALFWAARSLDLDDQKEEAAQRYRLLTEEYHAYWVPESLYRLAMIDESLDRPDQVAVGLDRLRQEFPRNRWTMLAEQIHGR
ncbi:MAG: hypothetical protein KJ950_13825 [Proteobacteria bacterium]|nr:hypothetical protein [Pseudomonadota bacterium]MBU1686088.1 hypothetical protein [Pseudomonadota bacterium]